MLPARPNLSDWMFQTGHWGGQTIFILPTSGYVTIGQQTDRIQPGGKEVGTIKHTQERGGLGNHAELNQVKSKVKLEEKSYKKNKSIRLESRVCQEDGSEEVIF